MALCSQRWRKGTLGLCTLILIYLALDALFIKKNTQENVYDFASKVASEGSTHGLDIRPSSPPKREVLTSPSTGHYNLTPSTPARILYNRIPKCASTAVTLVARRLARRKGFHAVSSHIFNRERINTTAQAQFTEQFSGLQTPLFFDRHINMVNFTRFGLPLPAYINVIRDPLERHVSDYYYKRLHLQSMFHMSAESRKRTYDKCVQDGYPECIEGTNKGYFRIIPFFCGQDPPCRNASGWALDKAKHNVVKYYSLVGVMEDLTGFMEVLEHIFPTYFRGATILFHKSETFLKKKLKTIRKIPPSGKTKSIMKKKLTYDYEFYRFISQRFYNTLRLVRKYRHNSTVT